MDDDITIPKSRLNLTYRTRIDGQEKDVPLPFRIVVLGDLSNGTSPERTKTAAHSGDLDGRPVRRLDGRNLDSVMADMQLAVRCTVPNRIVPDGDAVKVDVKIDSMKAFEPAEVAKQIPQLQALLLLKKLLGEVQMNIDNRKEFRLMLRALAADKSKVKALKDRLKDFGDFAIPPVVSPGRLPAAASPPAAPPSNPAPTKGS